MVCIWPIICRMEPLCDAAHVLESSGLRVTAARVRLLEALHSAGGLMTAQELHSALPGKGADLVTVYRFLAQAVRVGLAREIAGNDGVSYYEMACVHNPVHPHFECLSCGRLLCLPDFSEEDAMRVLTYGKGHRVENVSVVFRGICGVCLERRAEEGKE